MSGPGAHQSTFRLKLGARMDRRHAEALALALRRRVLERGFTGVRVIVTPAAMHERPNAPSRAPSVSDVSVEPAQPSA
jgi:hypothetical protein